MADCAVVSFGVAGSLPFNKFHSFGKLNVRRTTFTKRARRSGKDTMGLIRRMQICPKQKKCVPKDDVPKEHGSPKPAKKHLHTWVDERWAPKIH